MGKSGFNLSKFSKLKSCAFWSPLARKRKGNAEGGRKY
jgi:hypothetical protein